MPSKQPKSTLAPAGDLKREVQAAFEVVKPQRRFMDGFGEFDGFSYIGAEAYLYLAGGTDSDLQPMQLTHRNKSHWWLLDAEGRVIDLALGPREKSSFPYHRGKARAFRQARAGISRAAKEIVDRVRDARLP